MVLPGPHPATADLFLALQERNEAKCEQAVTKGANINAACDRWMLRHGKQAWGMRVPTLIFGCYLGTSRREEWVAPEGVSVDKGDTFIIILVKLREESLIRWLLSKGPDLNRRNRAGNSAPALAAQMGMGHLFGVAEPEYTPFSNVTAGRPAQENSSDPSAPLYAMSSSRPMSQQEWDASAAGTSSVPTAVAVPM
jgi:hypothetical protein